MLVAVIHWTFQLLVCVGVVKRLDLGICSSAYMRVVSNQVWRLLSNLRELNSSASPVSVTEEDS